VPATITLVDAIAHHASGHPIVVVVLATIRIAATVEPRIKTAKYVGLRGRSLRMQSCTSGPSICPMIHPSSLLLLLLLLLLILLLLLLVLLNQVVLLLLLLLC